MKSPHGSKAGSFSTPHSTRVTESITTSENIAVSLMDRFETTFDAWLGTFGDDALTVQMIRYHFGYGDTAPRRGKRLRPRMLLTIVQHERGNDEQAISDGMLASCAIELLHNYSLLHDDIEDGDELRHGRQTVWARYGIAHGINAGDMLCSMSYLALVRSGKISRTETAIRLAETLHDANYAMCIGQGRDIDFEAREHVSYEAYLQMIAGKTAALFGAACEMGAITARLSLEQQRAYAEYGRAYGKAFQMRDDILGTWGAVAATGKPSGADIKRRKWCFPVVWSLAQAPSKARQVIADAYAQRAPLDEATVLRVITALETLDARAAADDAANAALEEAAELARAASIDQNRALHHLFEASANRLA